MKLSIAVASTAVGTFLAMVGAGKIIFEPMFLDAARRQTIELLNAYDKQMRDSIGKDLTYLKSAVDKIEIGITRRLERIEEKIQK